MEKLTDKVKQIYDTYANENTYFDRIALVGCDTSRIRQGLTKRTMILLSGCLLARAWAALTATSLLPF
jgi:hypothetical protein